MVENSEKKSEYGWLKLNDIHSSVSLISHFNFLTCDKCGSAELSISLSSIKGVGGWSGGLGPFEF